MNTKLMTGAVVALLIILGVILYLSFTNSNKFEPEANISGRFDQVLASGEEVKCEFEHDDQDGNFTEGTVYVSGADKKVRADFTFTQQNEEPFEGHVIHADGISYVWGDFAEQGIKSSIDTGEENVLFKTENAEIPDTVVYECSEWEADDDSFVAPSDITFLDVSSQMELMKEDSADVKAFQCSACQNIPDEAQRMQCLSALSC